MRTPTSTLKRSRANTTPCGATGHAATRVAQIAEVYWPSEKTQTIENPTVNTLHIVPEE
jgi:hypothetical protein